MHTDFIFHFLYPYIAKIVPDIILMDNWIPNSGGIQAIQFKETTLQEN
jgi:hypothetical protein